MNRSSPAFDTVLTSSRIHMYVSQSDRGELVFGGGAPMFTTATHNGAALPCCKKMSPRLLELLPAFSRLRLMRQWAGITDITPDTTPLMGPTPVQNLYISGGWGTGGYKAIPAGGETMAYTIANDQAHPTDRRISGSRGLNRASLIDEGAASGVAH